MINNPRTIRPRPLAPSGVLLAAVALMACTDARPNAPGDASPPSAAAGVCRPAAARALIGRSAPDDAAILRRTGSATVQRLSPGQPMTRDFRRERVRVVIDPSGKVVAAICG